jgi:hypothetical protein
MKELGRGGLFRPSSRYCSTVGSSILSSKLPSSSQYFFKNRVFPQTANFLFRFLRSAIRIQHSGFGTLHLLNVSKTGFDLGIGQIFVGKPIRRV